MITFNECLEILSLPFNGNRMSKTVKIDGREFSEETVKKALQAHCDFNSDVEVPLKAGDVTKDKWGKGIIVYVEGKLHLIRLDGYCTDHQSSKRRRVGWATKKTKIGVLKDYIK